jgi:1,4-alpha-glucan branching enzyme
MIAYIKSIDGSDNDPSKDLPDGWSLMQWINDEIRDKFPGRISIGESMRNNPWVIKDVGAGGAGFNAQWDEDFVRSVRGSVIGPDDSGRHPESVARAIEHRYDPDAFRRIIFTESHDEVANGRARVPEEIWPGYVNSWFSMKRSTLAGALVLASPGIPMIFQGQELLEDRWFHDKDPIDWSKVKDERGILGMYRNLMALRRNLAGNTKGLTGQNVKVHHRNKETGIIAFHRWYSQDPLDSVVLAVNMFNQARDGYRIGFPRAGIWKTRFNSDSNLYDTNFANHASPDVEAGGEERDGMPCSGEIGIGPYTVVIFSQDE